MCRSSLALCIFHLFHIADCHIHTSEIPNYPSCMRALSFQFHVEKVAGIPSVIGAENYDVNRQTLSHCEGGHDEFWHKRGFLLVTFRTFPRSSLQPGEKKEYEPLPMILFCELCKSVQLFRFHQLTRIKRERRESRKVRQFEYEFSHWLGQKPSLSENIKERKSCWGKMLKIFLCLTLPDFRVDRTHAHSARWPRRTE